MAGGSVMDVRLVCSCGTEFLTTSRNRLGLCPVCVQAHSLAVERSRKAAYRQQDVARKEAACGIRGRERVMRLNCDGRGYIHSGPMHGFASLGDVYMANDGRMVGKRLRMDLMQVPHRWRPRNVLVADGRRFMGDGE
jgi:hypothetical protein